MTAKENRLHSVQRIIHALSPAEAEVWFTAVTDCVTPATDVRGRLVGPRCRYATTVEVAYPLRPLPRRPEEVPELTRRVVVPEPSFWDPQSPLLYRAFLELWQDGRRCGQATLDLGLRMLEGTPRTVYWNGKGLALRGTTRLPQSDEEWLRLRQGGCNLLLAPVEEPLSWSTACEVGFLVLGRLPATEQAVRQAAAVGGQVSCLGWVLGQDWLEDTPQRGELLALLKQQRQLLGVELDRAPRQPLPEGVGFVLCEERLLPALAALALPKLLLRPESAGEPPPPPAPPGVLGWVRTA